MFEKQDYIQMKSRVGKMISRLRAMENDDDGTARAGLAALRAGLRARDGVCIEAMPHVAPFLGDQEWRTKDRWFFAVATLFALHPQDETRSHSLGESFGALRSQSDSIEKRFQLLLSCDEDELFGQIVQIVSLLKSQGVPVNWFRLLDDLTREEWDDDERPIQLRWARDFYKTSSGSAPDSSGS